MWAFFGDGAAASPYYFSAVRSCKNLDIPVIFVNENNFQYMSIPVADTVPTKYVSDFTKGLDLPHHLVDGNDIAAVYHATKQAVEWAHAGNGPSVIEALTYRWYDHSGFAGARIGQEGATGLPYRTDDEVRGWMTRDPIPRYRRWLVAKGLAEEDETGPDRGRSPSRGRRIRGIRAKRGRSGPSRRRVEHPRRRSRSRQPVLQPQGRGRNLAKGRRHHGQEVLLLRTT